MKVPQLVMKVDVTNLLSDKERENLKLVKSTDPYVVGIVKQVNNSQNTRYEVLAFVRLTTEGITLEKPELSNKCEYDGGNICCSDKCFEISNDGDTTKLTKGGTLVVISKRNKRKYLVIDCFEGNVGYFDEVLASISDRVTCLVARKGKTCKVSLWDNLTGSSKEYVISCKSVRSVVCRDVLCVLSTNRDHWVVSFNMIYRVPAELEPVTKCGEFDYLYDRKHGILVKCNGDILHPLTPLNSVPRASCLSKSVIVAGVNDGLYIIEGNLSKEVHSGFIGDVSASEGVATFEVSKGMYRVVTNGWDADLSIKALSCTTLGPGYLLCLVKTLDSRYLLELLNPHTSYEPRIEVVRNSVDKEGYAEIRIIPWFETTTLTIDSRVKIVEEISTGAIKTLLIRPKLLGFSGNIRVMVNDPLFTVSSIVPITSSRPKLANVELIKCIYTEQGNVANESSNLYAKLRIKVEHSVPEEGIIKCKCQNLRNYVVNIKRLDHDVYETIITGEATSDSIVVEFSVSYGEDTYRLGRYVINLLNNRVKNPLVSNLFNIEIHDNEYLKIKPLLKGAELEVICRNGKRYLANDEGVMLSDCNLPILVRGVYEDNEGIKWYLSKFIEVPTKLRITRGGSKEGLDLVVKEDTIPMNKEVIITLPDTDPEVKDLRIIDVTRNNARFYLNVSNHEVISAAIAASVKNAILIKDINGNTISFNLPLDNAFYGITIHLVLIDGRVVSKHFRLNDVLVEAVKYASLAASKLINALRL